MDIERISKNIVSSFSEKEVERFLKVFLPKTKFANHAWSVGGYNRDELLGLPSKDLDIVVDINHRLKTKPF